nr:MAG TPA: hypothetical protein [Caudoviricetes sp.]
MKFAIPRNPLCHRGFRHLHSIFTMEGILCAVLLALSVQINKRE